jgi:hypothetical protein
MQIFHVKVLKIGTIHFLTNFCSGSSVCAYLNICVLCMNNGYISIKFLLCGCIFHHFIFWQAVVLFYSSLTDSFLLQGLPWDVIWY